MNFPFPRLDLSYCLNNEPPPLDFVLPGLVSGTVGSIVAPGAAGKSLLALQLAALVGAGADTLSLNIDKLKVGKVLVLAAEDPEPVLWSRVRALASKMQPDQALAFTENVTISPCIGKSGNLCDEGQTASMISQFGQSRLIIIDTLSRWHNGDENSRKDAVLVMRNLEKIATNTGAAVIFLHHTSKIAALNGQGATQQASRGSGVWVDEARWVAFLTGATESDFKELGANSTTIKKFVKFGVSKANYCPPQLDIWLERGYAGILGKASKSASSKYGEGKERGYVDDDF
jgi:RecA-family ATPase